MLVLIAVLTGCMTSVVLMERLFTREDRDHEARGLFGVAGFERLIATLSQDVVSSAEKVVRLHVFQRALHERAWDGTLFDVTPSVGAWRAWRFADGAQWEVQQLGGPRSLHRFVVSGARDREGRLAVRAYEPGGIDVSLAVVDVRPVA